MKKISVLLLGLVMVICLAACGGGSGTETTAAEGGNAVKGETVDVGDFEVLVPEGWWAYPQSDMFGEADKDGNYPLRTDAYGMVKGGSNEFDAFTKPTIYVYYYEISAEEQCESSKIWYDDAEDIKVTVNGTECPGFEADSMGYKYQIVFIPVSDAACIQVNIPTDMDGKAGVSADDADVMAIMESIKVK